MFFEALLFEAYIFMPCLVAWWIPWVGKISWRRKWQPTPVFLPGESHGWSSLVGYSPWGGKELDTTEQIRSLSLLASRSYPILCDLMDCSHQAPLSMGIFQARILECVVMPFSKGSSQPRDRTELSCIAGGFFTI